VAKQSFKVDGLAELQRELTKMDTKLRAETQKKGKAIADFVVSDIRAAASTPAERKTVPTVKRSGSNGVHGGGGGGREGAMFMGTEFGGRGRSQTQQFRQHMGRTGYFFWPTIRKDSRRIVDAWADVLKEVVPDGG
jgi:hypothetical protein